MECKKHPNAKFTVYKGTHAPDCVECHKERNKSNNPTNWKLSEAAKELFGKHRIRKTAHGRYVKEDFSEDEQSAIQIKVGNIVTVPTVSAFGGIFNMQEWRRGTKRSKNVNKSRELTNDNKTSCEEREDRGLAVIRRFLPDYEIEDHRKEAGPDFIAVSKTEGKKPILVDVKSGNVATASQVRIALQMEQEGIEFWMLDPDNERAMKITKDCEFIPTQYRIYAPLSA